MIQYPVPHNEEPGDDHVGEQAGTQKGSGDDEFIVHASSLHASCGFVSAQVSTFARIASSE